MAARRNQRSASFNACPEMLLCADIILDEFPVQWLRLRLDKPGAVPGSRSVGILIERGRRIGGSD
ncbi:MAG: hypothetical protein JJU31_15290 [Wenzhouxiangella sp.]|nr:hypothetical protein [Wenzhouxiangella sp.]